MKIEPINEKILILPKEHSNVKSGLTMPPEDDKKRPEEGKVVAIAKDIDTKKIGIKVGDTVLFDKYNADVYSNPLDEDDDKGYMVVSMSDIHAIVKK